MSDKTRKKTPEQVRQERLAAQQARREKDEVARQAMAKLKAKEQAEKEERKAERRAAKEAMRRRKRIQRGQPVRQARPSATTGDVVLKKDAGASRSGATASGASGYGAKRSGATGNGASSHRATGNGASGNGASGKGQQALVIAKPKGGLDRDPQDWVAKTGIQDTTQVPVPQLLIEQVLGQPEAVSMAHKAAEQKRHLLLIGDPGTGKSMLAKALAEILPEREQDDVVVYHNTNNPNQPKVLKLDGGTGSQLVHKYERRASKMLTWWRTMELAIVLGVLALGGWLLFVENEPIITILFLVLICMAFLWFSAQKRPKSELIVPKLLIRKPAHFGPAPYVDGTGSHAGALLGDVRHDPYQAGGLETPPHQRVEVGAIHRAHKGVLFIDEINTLRLASQQNLLTALQERQYAIAGQSQSSAGAMVKTEPLPCDFILVAAGNLDAVMTPEESLSGDTGMHPALRSRLRGYGYEVYVNADMDDTHENRVKMLQFVAQEVERDGKIPHFTAAAAAEIIREGQRRSGEAGKLTLRLRELGGLVRTSGDLARSEDAELVTREHVLAAKRNSRSLEQQMAETQIRRRLSQVHFNVKGAEVGTANGGASVGTGEVGEPAGLIVPVEAAVVTSKSTTQGGVTLGTGITALDYKPVTAVAPVIKRMAGHELEGHEVHLDARIPHEEAELHGIGLACAVAAYSALKELPVRQDHILIGGVAIKGQLRQPHNALQIIEMAAQNGFKAAVVPSSMRETLLVDDYVREAIEIVFCDTLEDVFARVLPKRVPSKPGKKAKRRA